MSYCRWSDDDFQCNLYCYPQVGDSFVTHVASMRRVFKKQLPPPISESVDDPDYMNKIFARHQRVMELCKTAEMVPIGLPCDGQIFVDITLEEFRTRVDKLLVMGYRAPRGLLDDIDTEIEIKNRRR